jgi:hypothetical protein
LAIWSFAFLLPTYKERAQKEVRSNIEVIQMCWSPSA